MRDELVERVARAISDNIQAGLPDGVTVNYEYAARAAIEAMREPTEKMTLAGYFSEPKQRKLVWQAMIDAALSYPGVTRDGKNVDL